MYIVPRLRTKLGNGPFSFSGLVAWNSSWKYSLRPICSALDLTLTRLCSFSVIGAMSISHHNCDYGLEFSAFLNNNMKTWPYRKWVLRLMSKNFFFSTLIKRNDNHTCKSAKINCRFSRGITQHNFIAVDGSKPLPVTSCLLIILLCYKESYTVQWYWLSWSRTLIHVLHAKCCNLRHYISMLRVQAGAAVRAVAQSPFLQLLKVYFLI